MGDLVNTAVCDVDRLALEEEMRMLACFARWRSAWTKTHPGYAADDAVRDCWRAAWFRALNEQEDAGGR